MDIEFLSDEPLDVLLKIFITNQEKDSAARQKALNSIVLLLARKKHTILQVIQQLGTYLLNSSEIYRGRSVLVLKEILERVKNLQIDSQQYLTLYEFFISKVKDIASTSEALYGILCLLNINQASGNKLYTNVNELLDSFVELLHSGQLHVSSYSQDVRFTSFKILSHFCQNHKDLVQKDANRFISVVINATEQEKDPRCLVQTFNLNGFLLYNFDGATLKPYLPEIFDNLSCYFPISFTPPENDPYKITPDDLRRVHNNCLASAYLVEDTLGLVFEKLAASQKETKQQCLNTLKRLIEVNFNEGFVQKQGTPIWKKLKHLILEENIVDIEDDILDTLSFLLKQMIPDNFTKQETISSAYYTYEAFANEIIEFFIESLHDGGYTKKSIVAGKALQTFAGSSYALWQLIMKKFVESLLKRLNPSRTQECQLYLENLFKLIHLYETKYNATDSKGLKTALVGSLSNLAENIKSIIQIQGSPEQLKILALRVYTSLIAEMENKEEAHGHVDIIISLYNNFAGDVSARFKNCIADALVIANYPSAIEPLAESLMNTLDGILLKGDQKIEDEQYQFFERNIESAFYLLETFSRHKHIYNAISKFILRIITQSLEKHYKGEQMNLQRISQILECYKNCLKNVVENGVGTQQEIETDQIDTFFNLFCDSQSETSFSSLCLEGTGAYYKTNRKAVKAILKLLESSSSLKDFLHSKINFYIQELEKISQPNSRHINLPFFYFYLRALSPTSCTSKMPGLSTAFVNYLKVDQSLLEQYRFPRKILFVLANKSEDVNAAISSIGSLDSANITLLNKLQVSSAVLKGLITKGASPAFAKLKEWLSSLEQAHQAQSLSSPQIIELTAFLFKAPINTSGLKVSPTYKQRIYVTMFGLLKERISHLEATKANETRQLLMQILTILISNLPFNVVKDEFHTIVDYMIDSLSAGSKHQPDPNVSLRSLEFIDKLLESEGAKVEYVQRLVLSMLAVIKDLRAIDRDMNDEITLKRYTLTLKCLWRLARQHQINIKIFKNEVIDLIREDLGHKRKVVRKHAVCCMNDWSLL